MATNIFESSCQAFGRGRGPTDYLCSLREICPLFLYHQTVVSSGKLLVLYVAKLLQTLGATLEYYFLY